MNRKLVMAGKFAGLLLLCLCGIAAPASAQDARLQINHLDKLAARATESVEVTLNDVQVQFLRKLVSLSESDKARLRGLLSKLTGVYVRGFEFAQDGEYSDADIEMIRAQLRAPGWERIVEVRNRNSGADEVFFMPRNGEIAGFAAISTEPRKVCVINIVGPMDMEDLAMLEKEFHLTRCGRSENRRHRRNTR
ncbi:MAG: DUF4252 domain-containing protein [Blastocatellales bacterium]